MEQWERDQIRSQNDHLRQTLTRVQNAFDGEMAELSEINDKLATMKVRATSPNDLARVTVNSAGVVTDITIADDAYRRSTPQKLTEDLNAAIQGAVEAAADARAQIVTPIESIVKGLPDFGDIVPGAPSWRDARAELSEQREPQPPRSD